MRNIQKISFFMVVTSLAHLLLLCLQLNLNNSKSNYENEVNLCLVLTQEQSITELSLFVPQVHLYARKESVFQNILIFSRYIWENSLQPEISVIAENGINTSGDNLGWGDENYFFLLVSCHFSQVYLPVELICCSRLRYVFSNHTPICKDEKVPL
mgnify:CR=1 FL=1